MNTNLLPRKKGLYDVFSSIIIIVLAIFFVIFAVSSLKWQMVHDTPIMFYAAFLMDKFGYVPYRDIFDFNLPGTYLINYLAGKVFGYSDISLRLADLSYLSAILAVTWVWLKSIGKKSALFSIIMFGIVYLGKKGPYLSFQREFFILLPITLSIYLACRAGRMNVYLKSALIGVLFGFCLTIKPHAIIGLPAVICFLIANNKEKIINSVKSIIKISLFALLGVALPVAVVWLYLWAVGALPYFIDIVKHYWPLYSEIGGDQKIVTEDIKWKYMIFHYFKYKTVWFGCATAGVSISLFSSDLTCFQKRLLFFLISMTFIYSTYPLFAGKFWDYHWLIYLFFIIILSSLCFIPPKIEWRSDILRNLFPMVIVIITLCHFFLSPIDFGYPYINDSGYQERRESVNVIASYLKKKMERSDRVQCLDWTFAGANAMLNVKARPATKFIYDFHFYHHINNSYTTFLRKKFIAQLNKTMPEFIIDITTENKPFLRGKNTTTDFPELKNFIRQHYHPDLIEYYFVVYKKSK